MSSISFSPLLALSLVMLLTTTRTTAQDERTVRGSVVDSATGDPLPYASVLIVGTTLGVSADDRGAFLIRVPAEWADQALRISVVGYKPAELQPEQIRNEPVVIRLEFAAAILKEVVVRDLSARDILKRAYQRKRQNYSSQPFGFEGYYEEIQTADGAEVSRLEAFATVHDPGYLTRATQKVWLQQFRQSRRYQHPVAPFWNTRNLLMAFIAQNFIKYNKSVRAYKVTRLEDVVIDGESVYVLEVSRRNQLWPSRLYISADNFAIVRTEEDFNVQRDGPRKWSVMENPAMKQFPQMKLLQIDYKRIDGRYYPDHYSMWFKTVYRDVVQDKDALTFGIAQRFVVTRIMLDNVPLSHGKELSESVSLDKTAVPYDTAFWETSPRGTLSGKGVFGD